MHEHALARPKTPVLKQPLPCSEPWHHEGRTYCEVNIARQWRKIACVNCHILRQGAVAIPVRKAEHALSYRQPRCAIAESGDHSRQFVAWYCWRPVAVESIGPGGGPCQLITGESRSVNLNDNVTYCCVRLGSIHEFHSRGSRSLICYYDCFHNTPPFLIIMQHSLDEVMLMYSSDFIF
jgi:hypothetical protein